MTHHMKLRPLPFSGIASGRKTIELRLLDEKRRRIHVGDTLIFTNADDAATLTCTVKALHVFADFEALYRALPLEKCGYLPEEVSRASAKDMEQYYSAQEQALYGVIGIEIELQ